MPAYFLKHHQNLKSLNKKFEDEFNHDVVPALQKAMI